MLKAKRCRNFQFNKVFHQLDIPFSEILLDSGPKGNENQTALTKSEWKKAFSTKSSFILHMGKFISIKFFFLWSKDPTGITFLKHLQPRKKILLGRNFPIGLPIYPAIVKVLATPISHYYSISRFSCHLTIFREWPYPSIFNINWGIKIHRILSTSLLYDPRYFGSLSHPNPYFRSIDLQQLDLDQRYLR